MKKMILSLLMVGFAGIARADDVEDFMSAITRHDIQAITCLLEKGVDIDFKDNISWTALMQAVFIKIQIL